MSSLLLAVAVALFAAGVAYTLIKARMIETIRYRGKGQVMAYAGCAGLQSLMLSLLVIAIVGLLASADMAAPIPLLLFFLAGGCVYAVIRAGKLAASGKRPRRGYEGLAIQVFWLCAVLAILITIGILFAVLGESVRFFSHVPLLDFVFGLEWSPQIAIREGQAGSSGKFGFIPLLAGTLLISAIAMLVALPLGLLAAVYLSEFASKRMRNLAKPMMEFLAGIPTVVYGFFAVVTLGPLLRRLGEGLGHSISSESALVAGLVIGIMTCPFVSSLAEDALSTVPQELRHGSLALGSTSGETSFKVVVPAALPGIFAGFLLAFSRAVGETMIVVMAAGLAANLTANPLEPVTTVTTQIVTLLIGDQEFDDPKTLAAFALGLALFVFTLVLNVLALHTVRKHHESYD